VFKSQAHSYTEKAFQYLSGLFQSETSNIEKMCARVEGSEAQNLNHFISNSPWDAQRVMSRVAKDTHRILQDVGTRSGHKIGLLIDESGWRKQGDNSVGVGRQYLGSLGKVDHGQVAVFASFVCGEERGLINTRLFLPESWTADQKRCEKAGIPQEYRTFKTKLELALELVHATRAQGLNFDWVGGDGFYGHDSGFRYALADDGEHYLLDVHSDESVYQEEPCPSIPPRNGNQGRHPTRYRVDREPVTVRQIAEESDENKWKEFSYRVGTKGAKRRKVLVKEVWTWNGEEATARKELLILSKAVDGGDLKYSLSNLSGQRLSWCELLFLQMQRYWVERSFEDAKSEVGMDEYQVRTWCAWHHHMALTMLALLLMLKQRVTYQDETPLLSCSDIRWILAHTLPKKARTVQDILELIQERHDRRQYDINRCLRKQGLDTQTTLT
jgi:SRSO17 transposase